MPVKIAGIAPQALGAGLLLRVVEGGPRRTEAQPMQQFRQADHIAALSAAMAVENILAAVDIERWPAVAMQWAHSAHLVGLAVGRRFPSMLFEVSQQRN